MWTEAEYDVYLRANQAQFNGISDVSRIYLRAASGEDGEPLHLGDRRPGGEPAAAQPLPASEGGCLTADVAPATLGSARLPRWLGRGSHLPAGMTVDYASESKDYRDNQGRW